MSLLPATVVPRLDSRDLVSAQVEVLPLLRQSVLEVQLLLLVWRDLVAVGGVNLLVARLPVQENLRSPRAEVPLLVAPLPLSLGDLLAGFLRW